MLIQIRNCAKENTYRIEKSTSALIKGVAAILMLVHHMYTFPGWVVAGAYSVDPVFAQLFRNPTRICVGMFAFITGWAFVLKKEKTLGHVLQKIATLYTEYWVAFFVLFLFAFSACGYRPGVGTVLAEMTGFSGELMLFCWYVPFWAAAVLLLHGIRKVLDQSFWWALLGGIVFPIVIFAVAERIIPVKSIATLVNHLKHFFPCVAVGYICCRYNVFEILRVALQRINRLIVLVLTVILVSVSRYYITAADFIYSPMLIFAIANAVQGGKKIKAARAVEKLLQIFGKYSANIWYLHCVVFSTVTNRVVQPYVYWSANPLANFVGMLFFILLISYVLSFVDRFFLEFMRRVKNALFLDAAKHDSGNDAL
nr:hypothetical protein [Lachnospiraceae bacterium]